MAFASNLLGAMVGGALEYVALLSGYRSLLIVVAGLYVLAYLFASRWRGLADRGLEARQSPEPELVALSLDVPNAEVQVTWATVAGAALPASGDRVVTRAPSR
jgi:hypothetical protein